MRQAVGDILPVLLATAAGSALLVGFGMARTRLRSLLAAAGLAYLVGFAATGLVQIALLAMGVPFSAYTYAAVCIATVVAVVLLRRRSAASASGQVDVERRAQRGAGLAVPGDVRGLFLGRAVMPLFIAAFGVYAVIGLLDAAVLTPGIWDSWSLYARKAILLHEHGGLPAGIFSSPAYEFMQPDYPLLLPLNEALQFEFAGVVDTRGLQVQFWVLLVAFVWAMAYCANRFIPAWIWAPLLLAFALAPRVHDHLLTAYADVPMAIFLGLGTFLVGMWLGQTGAASLWPGVLLLAAAASLKHEGAVAAVLVLASAIGVALATRRRRESLALVGGVALLAITALPWRIWSAAHGLQGDRSLSQAFDPSGLVTDLDRSRTAVSALHEQLTEPGWFLVVPVAVALVVAAVLLRAARAAAAFYACAGVAVFISLPLAYGITDEDLSRQLANSAYRVVAGVVFIAAAAVIHLAGALHGRGRAANDEPLPLSG